LIGIKKKEERREKSREVKALKAAQVSLTFPHPLSPHLSLDNLLFYFS